MSSLSPIRLGRAAALAAALAALAGCGRQGAPTAYVPAAQTTAEPAALTELFPGGAQPPPRDPRGALYEGDAGRIAQGKLYFGWYNCSGCHFNGGGGIGPAFTDKTWIYGGRIDQIHNSIVEGRPNGMPSWRGKIPDAQIWEIAAYVRSLEPPAPPDAPVGQTSRPS